MYSIQIVFIVQKFFFFEILPVVSFVIVMIEDTLATKGKTLFCICLKSSLINTIICYMFYAHNLCVCVFSRFLPLWYFWQHVLTICDYGFHSSFLPFSIFFDYFFRSMQYNVKLVTLQCHSSPNQSQRKCVMLKCKEKNRNHALKQSIFSGKYIRLWKPIKICVCVCLHMCIHAAY